MELFSEAWATFLNNDPVPVVVVCAVFLWLAWISNRSMNAPMRECDWETVYEPEARIDSLSTGGTVWRMRRKARR
jgi:hypothetical protein